MEFVGVNGKEGEVVLMLKSVLVGKRNTFIGGFVNEDAIFVLESGSVMVRRNLGAVVNLTLKKGWF